MADSDDTCRCADAVFAASNATMGAGAAAGAPTTPAVTTV